MRFVLATIRRLIGCFSIPYGSWFEATEAYVLWSLLLTAVVLWMALPLTLGCLQIILVLVAAYVVVTLVRWPAFTVLPKLVRWRWRLWILEMQRLAARRAAPAGPILLYLRPFDADFATAAVPAYEFQSEDDLVGYDEDGYPLVTGRMSKTRPIHFERWLRAGLLPWGRLVALANPTESRNRSSSFHIVADDGDWRGIVEHLCRHAELIVCMVPTERFVGVEPMLSPAHPAARIPSFSRDATYASFFDELRHLSDAGHTGKLMLVIPDANMTAEKWSVLRASLADVGISVPDDPVTVTGNADSGLGLFVIDENGRSRIHYWMRTFPTQEDWNAKIWRVNVRILERLLGRPAPRFGLLRALPKQRWLLGSDLADIVRILERMERKHAVARG